MSELPIVAWMSETRWAFYKTKNPATKLHIGHNPIALIRLSAAQSAIAALEAENQRLREVVSKVNDRCDHLGMSLGEIKAERDALRAECEGLRKDAARYRWLRTQNWYRSSLFVVSGGKSEIKLGTYCPIREQLDAAIDAAMEGQEP